ncbi:DDE-domain-containing protein, partial [Gyrodon lividus]
MTGHSKSQTKKKQIISEHQEEALTDTIKIYQEEQQKPEEERRSLQTICQEVEGRWQKKSNAWLATDEEEQIIMFCIDLAARGFPLNHRSLKVHVDSVLCGWLGSTFPETGVGKNWIDCFLERHSGKLSCYWSASLDTARGHAVNENTNKAWFDLLGKIIEMNNIEQDCLWAADKTGFQPGGGLRGRVIGPAGKKRQHQQHDRNRENITVMVTICADGEAIPPTVIYKGQSFSTTWHAEGDDLKVSVAHSLKGWSDGGIRRLWIEYFDQKTREKANGCAQLLLVDGHNSHYTKEFLEYARNNDIHVLCYPAHTTHIYQALDVVIYGPLKHYWTQEHDQYKSTTRRAINKGNFVSVYTRAHLRALTLDNIHAAFKKMGAWPFNPNAVTKEMMAPSLETLSIGQLPLPQPSPVHAISATIHQY